MLLLIASSGLSLSLLGFILCLLLLESLLFPDKDTFEHDPQGEDGNEHEDLLPGMQLDRFEQRPSQFKAQTSHHPSRRLQTSQLYLSGVQQCEQCCQQIADDQECSHELDQSSPEADIEQVSDGHGHFFLFFDLSTVHVLSAVWSVLARRDLVDGVQLDQSLVGENNSMQFGW